MRIARRIQTSGLLWATAIFVGCPSAPSIPTVDLLDQLPELCAMQAGLSVESITITPSDQIDLLRRRGITVGARLNVPAAPAGQAICFVVRDDQFPVNPPLTLGFVTIQAGQTSITNPNVFFLSCDTNRHVVAEPMPLLAGDGALSESSNERSTKIFAQHVADTDSFRTMNIFNPVTQEFQNALTGISGVKSNRPRVNCPR